MNNQPLEKGKIGRLQFRSFEQIGKEGSFVSHSIYRTRKVVNPETNKEEWPKYFSFTDDDIDSYIAILEKLKQSRDERKRKAA